MMSLCLKRSCFFAIAAIALTSTRVSAQGDFSLAPDDVVVFAGGAGMVSLQRAGYFEAILTHAFADAQPTFRDLAWEADTVFALGTTIERWRQDGFGSLDDQLERLNTTVVIAQFGRLESMTGREDLTSFTQAYQGLIDAWQKRAKHIVLVSPMPFEKPSSPLIPDVSKHNADLALYVKAIAGIAARRNLIFIDLFTESGVGLTGADGMRLKAEAQRGVAYEMARKLGIAAPTESELEALRLAVIEKHRLWYDYWRPANWKLLYGDDAERQFTRAGKDYIPFKEEWRRLVPLIAKAEQRVWRIARGETDPGPNRPAPEVLHGDEHADIGEELASFKTPEGLRVNLFASEKDGLTSPLALRWDTAGRMFVTITTTYPHVFPGDLPNDKIIVLEDTDHDGRADKSTVFAEGLNMPTGLELGDGGVYVGQNTELLFLQDTDGDGRADTRRVILGGFGNGDSHQTINSFVWSPGGELYFGQGDGIESRVETPWGPSHLFQAGFHRFRPRRLQLHPLLDDFMGPGNPWGVAFDDWGQIFSVDGAGGVTYLSPGQIPTTHRQKLREIGREGGYCGIAFLDGKLLPESMHGDFAIGDYKANRVKRFSVEADGAGYSLQWKQPLLQSSHRNFRPVDVKIGPDGALYVVDWYNPITCHQDDAYRDPTRDKAHGRIWRVSSGAAIPRRPTLAGASLERVVNALQSRDRWTRDQAKREMTTRDANQVARQLAAWIETLDPRDARYEHHLYEALAAYATIEWVEPELLGQLLDAKDPRARAYAARMVGRWHDRLDQPLEWLSRRVEDEHPQVRMEAVMACAAIPSPQSIQVAVRVVDGPVDPWIDYALTQAIHHLRPHWLEAFKRGDLTFARPAHLAVALNEVGGKKVIGNLRLIARSSDLDTKARGAAIAAILVVGGPRDVSDYGLNPEIFTRSGEYDAAFHAKVLAELVKLAKEREIRPEDDPSPALNRMIDLPHPGLRSNALTLAGLWQAAATGPQVLAVVKDDTQPIEVRSAAFRALAELKLEPAGPLLASLAARPHALPVRAAAIEALCALDIEAAARHAAELLPQAVATGLNPASILEAFLDRRGGGKALATALHASKMSPESASAVLQSLYETGRSDRDLVEVLRQSTGVTDDGPPYTESYVKQLVGDAMTQGNAQRGATLVEACIACHRIGKLGAVIGPDLTSIGTTLSPERIAEEVLWPGRQVKEGYTMLQVTTQDGVVHHGYERWTRQSEASGDLVMRQLTAESLITLRRDQIVSRKTLVSPMPVGLTAGMTQQQLLDMIRYVITLGTNTSTP